MLLIVVVVGTAFLVGLAIAVGVESDARARGWRGIAGGRRELAERRRALDEREQALAEEQRKLSAWESELGAGAEPRNCPVCDIAHPRGTRHAD